MAFLTETTIAISIIIHILRKSFKAYIKFDVKSYQTVVTLNFYIK